MRLGHRRFVLFAATWLAFSGCGFAASSFASPPQWREIVPDVVYGHKDGLAMTYDVVRPIDNANGAGVLFMVSGGWVSRHVPPELVVRESPGDEPNVWEALVQSGYTLYLVRHGSSPRYKVPEAVSDVRRAIRHIRANADDFEVDAQRIGVCGGSAGGHLALMLGTSGDDGDEAAGTLEGRTSSRVQAVVAYFPPTDLREYVGPDSEYVEDFPALDFPIGEVESVSPLLQVTDDDAPSLMIHGDQDTLVPLSHSERIAEAFEEAGVVHKLIVIEGAAHGFDGEDSERAQDALIDWFDKQLADDDAP